MKTIKHSIIVSSILFLVACTNENLIDHETENEISNELIISKSQFKAGDMQLIQFKKQSFKQGIMCAGVVDVPPQSKAVISAIMGGYVKKSALLIGDEVKRGEAILSLENPEYADLQQHYLETKASINYLEEDYKRQKSLHDEKISSTKEYLKAKSSFEQANAKLQGLAEKLRLISIQPAKITADNISATVQIYAPINGRVSMVNISQGTYVDPSQPLMEIIALDHLHLELNVFEQDYLKIKKGQKIQFTVPEASEQQFEGEVHLIGNTIEQESRTVKVHGHLDTDSINFAIGMFIEAQIILNSENILAAPNSAIIKTENTNEVLRLQKETASEYVFVKDAIKIGSIAGDTTAILDYSAWSENNKYLIGAYHFINETEGGGHSH